MNENLKIEWKELPVNTEGLKEFPVDMKKWARGGASSLLNWHTKKQCCLGCLGTAHGIPDEIQEGLGYPYALIPSLGGIESQSCEEYIAHFGSITSKQEIADCNDDSNISDVERMERLTELFAKIGYKPVFINDETE